MDACTALDPWIAVALVSAGLCLGVVLVGLATAAREPDPKDTP